MPKPKKSSSQLRAKIDEDINEEVALRVATLLAEKKKSFNSNTSDNNDASKGHGSVSLPRVTSLDKDLKPKAAKKKVKGAEGKAKTKKKPKVKGQSSSKNLLKGQSSSKSLVKVRSSEERKLKPKNYPEGNDVDNNFPYENVNEPMEISHASQSRNEKPVPPMMKDANRMDTSLYLARVQSYFDQLEYHRVGEPKIHVNTRLSIKHLMETAKELIQAGEPIKCLHALILAVHFTNPCTIIERFPLHFKSKVNGKEYKHVVLGVYAQGYFGTLGISRDPSLQDKPPAYSRLSDLINDFYKCYTESGHELMEVKIGAIITHDVHSLQTITWKLGVINFRTVPRHMEVEIERSSKKLRSQMGLACLRCVRPNPLLGANESLVYPSLRPPFGSSSTSRSKAYALERQEKSSSLSKAGSKAMSVMTVKSKKK